MNVCMNLRLNDYVWKKCRAGGGGGTKLPRSYDMGHEPSGGGRQAVQRPPSMTPRMWKLQHIDAGTRVTDLTDSEGFRRALKKSLAAVSWDAVKTRDYCSLNYSWNSWRHTKISLSLFPPQIAGRYVANKWPQRVLFMTEECNTLDQTDSVFIKYNLRNGWSSIALHS